MPVLYNLIIRLFILSGRIAAFFNKKAALWLRGQKGWEAPLRQAIGKGNEWIWFHCASLGEFEQGRPVLEEIKKKTPGRKIILTFFSPSGYEVRKNYRGADYICYLPADTGRNARLFLEIVDPVIVIFVKYEFWNNYISETGRGGKPFYLVSAIFRPGQHFFSWYGGFFRRMLEKFTCIFVQDKRSVELLGKIGINNTILAGDTRFDRVVQIAANSKRIEKLEQFRGDEKLFIAGSSWSRDEEIIAEFINRYPSKMKWVFAPHEIDEQNINRLESLFKTSVVRYSKFEKDQADARVMILDNIGMLSSAYGYAHIAVVGGGFGKGIHNILEPACWGIPVLFGPNHTNFREAVEMRAEGGACSFSNYYEFEQAINKWVNDDSEYRKSAGISGTYIKKNTGATGIILRKIYPENINSGI
jgi:3-deoxy-D-manno-octulosonic-acid transferase